VARAGEERGTVSETAPPAPWYFRYRASLIGAAYGFGFFFGYLITSIVASAQDRPALMSPTFVQLGALFPELGSHGMLGVILLLVILGWATRVWGASFLSSDVVWSAGVETGAFHVAGPYRFTRNPLYFGNLCWALAFGAFGPPLVTILVFALNWLVVEALVRTEERFLLATYGERYAAYKAQVPRLLPLIFRSAPGSGERAIWAQGFRSEIWGLAFVAATAYCFITQTATPLTFALLGGLLIMSSLVSPGKPPKPS
jgi:protein-S-isoprenylcysteine O-methyltransferase Ste14